MFSIALRGRSLILTLILGGMLAGTGSAVADQHDHSSSAAPAAAAKKAEPARKFATDETLRQGMAGIAALLGPRAKEIQDGKLASAIYVDMAVQIEAQVANIVKNCKLDKNADQALHDIVADFNYSVRLMRGNKPEVQRAGALAATQALRNYGKYFDHPGWSGPL